MSEDRFVIHSAKCGDWFLAPGDGVTSGLGAAHVYTRVEAEDALTRWDRVEFGFEIVPAPQPADELAALRRQNVDLQAANNRLLERARKAEAIKIPSLNVLASSIHTDNAKWWHDLDGAPIQRNKGEALMLMVSEIAEAMEGERKGLMDDKLPHRKMAEVELADTLIRIFDYAAGFGYDLDGAVAEKRAFNLTRNDHTLEARRAAGGKKF